MAYIDDFERVRAILGEPNPATARKIQSRLNERMIGFIQASPLLMLATVDAEGFPTISPKGDDPGFVKVVDDQTLLLPERKGNKLAFSFENLLQQDRAGLIFLVPGTAETLRVHGRCRLLDDPATNQDMASKTQQALLVLELRVTRCYFHCGKALLRSRTWEPQSWGPRQKISFGQEIMGKGEEHAAKAAEVDQAVAGRYKTDL